MATKSFSKVSRVFLVIAGFVSFTLAILLFIYPYFGLTFAIWMVIFGLIFNGFAGLIWAAGASGARRGAYGAYGGFSSGLGFFFLFILLFGIWIPGFVAVFALWMFAFSLIFFGILNILMGSNKNNPESSGLKAFKIIMGIIIIILGILVLIFPVFGAATMIYVTAFNLISMGILTLVWGFKGSVTIEKKEPPPKAYPKCPNCGALITVKAKICPDCGAKIKS